MQSTKAPKKTAGSNMLEKAKRTKSARQFAGLTREEMSTRHHIPPSTLRGWESPGSLRNQGLTLKGAQRLAKALQKEGVLCAVEWLMEGTGIGPQFISTPATEANQNIIPLWEPYLAIQNEILCFEKNNPDAIVVMVSDDGLSPFFLPGDYIGGIKKYQKEISSLIDSYCIVETSTKEILVRKLCPGKKTETFTLSYIHAQTTAEAPLLANIKLNWAAAIIWHRKPG